MTTDKILLVSYHFFPSLAVGAKRFTALAQFLAARGYSVEVVCCGDMNEIREREYTELKGITVHPVRASRKLTSVAWRRMKRARNSRSTNIAMNNLSVDNSDQSAQRKPNFFRETIRSWNSYLQTDKVWLLRCILKVRSLSKRQRYSVVLASGPPVASYLAGSYAARRLGTAFVLDFRDPWLLHHQLSDSNNWVSDILGRLEGRMAQACISQAVMLVSASAGIKKHLGNSYDIGEQNISVIRNGYDEDAVVTVPAPVAKLSMLYAGTLYFNRNPFPFLEALKSLVSSSDVDASLISFLLVGRCRSWNGRNLDEWLENNGLRDNVEIQDSVPAEQLQELTLDANVLVNFSQGQPLQIPAKTYEQLASGRDIVCLAEPDSNVADVYREAGMGYVVKPNDIAAMTQVLHMLYDKYVRQENTNACKYNIESFSRLRQLERYHSELLPFLSPGKPSLDR